MKKIYLILFTVILLIQGSLWSEYISDLVEIKKNGSIDWSKRIAEARGKSVESARRNLFDVICEIRIDSVSKIKDLIEKDASVIAKIKEMTEQSVIVKRRYLSDGTVEVTMQLPLSSGFSQYILPDKITQIESVTVVSIKGETKKQKSENEKHSVHTGLIVDATGINVMPSLVPTILDEDKNEIYGANFVSREFAVQTSMSEYTTDIEKAKKSPIVGKNPLIVKGLHAYGELPVDIIISNSDALKIKQASEHLIFLKKCNVVIVVNPLPVPAVEKL